MIESMKSFLIREDRNIHLIAHRIRQRIRHANLHSHMFCVLSDKIIAAHCINTFIPTANKDTVLMLTAFLQRTVIGNHIGINLIDIGAVCIIHHVRSKSPAGPHVDLKGNNLSLFPDVLIFGQTEEFEMDEPIMNAEGFCRSAACIREAAVRPSMSLGRLPFRT